MAKGDYAFFDIDFKLIPWQEQVEKAILEGARYVYIKAGRKSGKTEYVKYRTIVDAFQEPLAQGQVNAYIAPSRQQAKNILWRRLKASLPPKSYEKKPRESDLIIDMRSGIRQQLFGSENEDAIRGLIFGPTKLDEADFMRPNFFEEVVEPNFSVTKAPCMMTSTPKNGWFTKRWKAAKEGRLGRDHVAFHFTIYDNPHISREEIERIKANTLKEIWEQEYMANENAYCGLMYAEFEPEHVANHREPKGPLFARGLDWGFDHPSHCLWGEIWFNQKTNRWNLYIYREMSMRGTNVANLVIPILAIERERAFLFNVIDISARRTEMASGHSIIQEFHNMGLPCRVPQGSPDWRINAAKMMLKQGDIQISDQCPILIKQLREVEWGQNKHDDATDAFQYLCAMVYKRDFSTMDLADRPSVDLRDPRSGPIDPMGILAVEEQGDHLVWDKAGYLA